MGCTCTSSTKPPKPLNGSVELLLLKSERIVVARQEVSCVVPPRGRQTLASDALLDGFYDVTYSYRFGPPSHDAVVATLFDGRHEVLSEAFYFVQPREPSLLPTVQLDVEAVAGAGCYEVVLHCDHLLKGVSFDAKGFLPDDNYFHLPPARCKRVRFIPPRGRGFRVPGDVGSTEPEKSRRDSRERGARMTTILSEQEPRPAPPSAPRTPRALRASVLLREPGQWLFAWLHRPEHGPLSGHGVVLCPPIGHEQIHAHRG